ncbi:hypothetical protein CEP76_07345 [[Haemophilus] ducreyi]|uniref:Formate dehydrogenase, iron-sulfur subunit, beta subunit n=1 Tax=Haemophilus ducreyi (strain 35000HP / ATCC 700724) TaxID=233412 RepID=Q7VM82_HAEDU|nr:formate dehydrogenase, iron-sulfur subunit, beta subunit [[Haemophilus] ducreyi 35000HP]ASE07456.1 hypothetical protein CEP76_07345 [[Haemophilus] ducreyi]
MRITMGSLALAEIAHYITIGPNIEEDIEDHQNEGEQHE